LGWEGAAGEEDGEEVEVDGLGAAEEFEEDFDAILCGGDGDDGAFEAAERAGGDFDFVAGFDGGAEGERGVLVSGLFGELGAEALDEGFGDGRDF
jgi:hypothetical protein